MPNDPTLRDACGQLLMVGFDGTTLADPVRDALSAGRLGGVILFRRNLDAPEQIADLNATIYSAAGGRPLPFLAVDQEGGRVQRIREPLCVIPPMWQVGATGDLDLAVRVGQVLGEELEALGFNLDFAPCADTWTNPMNRVIGDRSFSNDPQVVGRMAGALSIGLTMSGIVPCAKHFPGHGDTLLDSHEELPVVEHAIERLRAIEMLPFQMLVRGKIPMIMTAHLMVPAIDTRHPITLSENGLTQALRKAMGFDGVIISDDLEMKAVADRYSISELVTLGLRAGVDLFLICHTREKWEAAWETLVKLGERGGGDRERIVESAERVARLKRDYLRPWARPANLLAELGTAAHRAVLDRIAAHRV